VWHDARHALPFVFAGSSLAAAGGACMALTAPRDAAPARAQAVAGALLELAAAGRMQRGLEPVVRRSYEGAPAHALHRAAQACAIGGACVTVALAGRSRSAAIAAGAALVAGSALQRWAIFKAGIASSQDPEQTVAPQRARRDATNGALTGSQGS
jgi:hypothetical protein